MPQSRETPLLVSIPGDQEGVRRGSGGGQAGAMTNRMLYMFRTTKTPQPVPTVRLPRGTATWLPRGTKRPPRLDSAWAPHNNRQHELHASAASSRTKPKKRTPHETQNETQNETRE
eukprot:902998-Prorocentrum_minimum.AAC.1